MSPFPLTAELPGLLEFSGEFGAEVNSFLPFVHWAHLAGLMRDRRIRTYGGMGAFYPFLDAAQIEEKPGPRCYVAPADRPPWLPNRDDHAAARSPFECFPDYRARYRDGLFATGRPLLVVHNKYSVEWGRAPVNFIPLDLLDHIFTTMRERFQIVYLRPGIAPAGPGYSADHQPDLHLADLALVRRFPDVVLFDDIVAGMSPRMAFNEAKLRLYAHAHLHLTAQGGNAHLLALFGGGLHAVLHRFGQEIRGSYAHGHFAYAANPAPTWLICRTPFELAETLPAIQDCAVVADRVLVPPVHAALIQALSPAAQCGADRMLPPDLAQPAA